MSAYAEALVVPNEGGLHLRVAALAARAASRFGADVRVSLGGVHACAKSALELLSLGAAQGSRLTVTGDGADACEAVRAVAALLRQKAPN